MGSSTIILIIIFVFTFVPLVLAEFARKNSGTTASEFFLQDRKMPFVLLFFTVYATWVSSFAVLGATGSFYFKGPLYMTCFAWNVFFGLLFMKIGRRIWFFGKTYCLMTPSDFFRFFYRSNILSNLVTIIIVIFTIPYLMIQLYGGALIIETISGGMIPWRVSGLIFYAVIIIYLWSGGLKAVALTDIFYGSLTFITMLLTGFLLVHRTGGIEQTFAKIMETTPASVLLDQAPNAGPMMWISMFFAVPVGAMMSPPMWTRTYAAGRAEHFNKIPFFISIATIMYLGPLLSAAAFKARFPHAEFSDNIIATGIMDYTHPVMGALLLCGIAAASLSTANSQIHSLSTICTIDIYKQLKKEAHSEYKLVRTGRFSVILVSAVAYIFTLMTPLQIIEIGILALAGTFQLIVPTLGALFWKKSSGRAATLGLIAGILITLAGTFILHFATAYCAMVGAVVNTLIFCAGSILLTPDAKAQSTISDNQKLFFRRNRS